MWAVLKTLVALAVTLVVQWIKGQDSIRAALKQRDTELAAANTRIAALEAAVAVARAERLRVVDEKAAAVTDARTAAELLRDVTGADKPDTEPLQNH